MPDLRSPPPNVAVPDTPSASGSSPFNRFRGSIAWTEGFETQLHVLAKDQYPDRAMGVFTSGGDAQGKYTWPLFLLRRTKKEIPMIEYRLCSMIGLLVEESFDVM